MNMFRVVNGLCTRRHLSILYITLSHNSVSFYFIWRISSIKISKDNVKHSLNLDCTKKMNVLKMFRNIIKITSHLDTKYKQ